MAFMRRRTDQRQRLRTWYRISSPGPKPEGCGWGLLGGDPRQSLGRVSSGSRGLAEDAGVGASYRGCVDPDSIVNAGLRVDGEVFIFFLPWLVCCEVCGWRCLKTWMLGQQPHMAVYMVGSLAGTMAATVAMPLGRVDGDECSVGWLRLALCRWKWRHPDLDLDVCARRGCPWCFAVAWVSYETKALRFGADGDDAVGCH